MIGKSGVWGSATMSGGAAIGATALAGLWLVQMPRPRPPESRRPPATMASPTTPTTLEERAPSSSPSATALEASALSQASSGLRVDIARIMPNGDVVIAGRSEPGARVALLDNGETLLETQADPATGEFVMLPSRLATGAHHLSLRSTASSERVQPTERFIEAFSISPSPSPSPEVKAPAAPASAIAASSVNATIVRGDTLWRISRERLGRGALYPAIYQANSTMIRDPNLIYPGHTLTIP